MPITARFSKLFYDRLGDEVVNELMNWLNAIDGGYRDELRELNENNYARFDASVKQQFAERFAEQNAWIERRFSEQNARFERRFSEQNARFEQRFARIDERFAQIDERFAQVDQRFVELDAKLEVRFAQLDAKLERGLKEHTRWMFVVWSSLLIPIVGLWMRG